MDILPPAPSPAKSSRVLLQWSARVSDAPERGRTWYMVGGGAVLCGAAYGILSGAWTVAVVCVLCGAVYVLLRGHVPPVKTIAISEQGVEFDGVFFGYGDMRSFWIIQTPAATELHIARKRRGGPQITIQTGLINVEELRKTLGQFLVEESDRHETFLDAIIRICKL